MIDLVSAARDEVVGLHEFFVAWFTGALEATESNFERVALVMHPEFSMIVPSGDELGRDVVVESIRTARSTADASFGIEIRGFAERVTTDDVALVTYEEWQFVRGGVDSCRVSTALFVPAPGTPNGVQWRHLHETVRSS